MDAGGRRTTRPRLDRVGRSAALVIAISCLHGEAIFLGGCGARQNDRSAPAEQSKDTALAAVDVSAHQTQVEMVNVDIHLDPDLVLHIHYLSGQFLPTIKGQPPAFDDKLSYIVAIDSAEIGVRPGSPRKGITCGIAAVPSGLAG